MKIITTALFILISISILMAQPSFSKYDELPGINLNYKPAYSEDFPEWAKMLYQYPVNFDELVGKYETYFKNRGKEKSPIIRYYKIWKRAVEPYVLSGGEIKLPEIDQLYSNLYKTQLTSKNKLKSASTVQSEWSFLGPKNTYWLNESGSDDVPGACPWQVNVYSLDVATTNNDIIYCGTETGFVNKTTNKGENWQQLGADYVFGGGITAVAIHPGNDDVVYVAGGNQVHKTTDGGESWTPLLSGANLFKADRLKIDPNNADKIVVASDKGIYVSTNGGSNWTKAWTNQSYDVEFKPGDSNVIFAICKNSSNKFQIVVSNNGGTSFSAISTFPTNISNASGGLLAMTPANSNVLYATMLASEGSEKLPLIYKGTNNNGTWTWSNTKRGEYSSTGGLGGFTNGQGYFDLVFEVSPENENMVFWGTCSLWKSTDGARNFYRVGGYGGDFAIHPDIQDMKILPSGVTWVATDGGITLSTDNFVSTSNAISRTNGIVGSDMWGFDQGWNEDIVVGGRYHNGNTAVADFYGDKALRMGGAESPTGWVLQGKSRHVAFNDLGNGWILPKTATSAPEGRFIFSKYPNMDEYGGRRSNLLHHPNYYGVLYLGEGNGFWKSSDMGVSFDLLHNFPGKVRYLQISYSNPDIIYADVVDYGLYRSSDGGKNWENKSSLTNGQYGTSYWKGRLFFTISPNNEDVIYACLQNGTWSKDIGKVFKSEDGGTTWQDYTGTVSEHTKCLVVQPDKDGNDLLYLFTISANGYAAKVYYRNSEMNNWAEYSNNYPAGMSVNIALPFFRDSKLRVGGNGSIWETTLAEPDFKPILNFWVEKPVYNCMSDTVCFDDHSILNHEGAEWEWQITPEPQYISDANSRNPKVVLGQTGKYSVTLTLSKDGQTYSKTIEDMVETTTCPSLEDCSNPAEIPQNNWTLLYVDSEEISGEDGRALNAFDGDPATIWHTAWSNSSPSHPHEIQLDLNKEYNIHEIIYLPRQNGYNGRIKSYQLYISKDKNNWGNAVKTGTFPNSASPQKISFTAPILGRYVKLKALSEVNGGVWTSIAELTLTGCYGSDNSTASNVISNDEKITAFPVPTDGLVNINLPSNDDYSYSVYSISGEHVMSGIFDNQSVKQSLNLKECMTGVYFIKLVNDGNRIYRIKVVKK